MYNNTLNFCATISSKLYAILAAFFTTEERIYQGIHDRYKKSTTKLFLKEQLGKLKLKNP